MVFLFVFYSSTYATCALCYWPLCQGHYIFMLGLLCSINQFRLRNNCNHPSNAGWIWIPAATSSWNETWWWSHAKLLCSYGSARPTRAAPRGPPRNRSCATTPAANANDAAAGLLLHRVSNFFVCLSRYSSACMPDGEILSYLFVRCFQGDVSIVTLLAATCKMSHFKV